MRGELKLMENVIAFFVIIIIGMIALIFFTLSQSSAQSSLEEQRDTARAVQAARALYNLPELSCTFSSSGRCIDAHKAVALSDLISTDPNVSDTYLPVLGQSEIAIRCLGCEANVTVYDMLNANTYRQIQVPVLLHNATSGSDRFAWIEVRV